jgi:NAD(P)-dependent dehydrogenase (short-subunit alcohol dehydrogenase family)
MLLVGQGVRVHAVLTGPVDTDMTRGFEVPKGSWLGFHEPSWFS